MTFSSPPSPQLFEDLLTALTDAALFDEDLESVVRRYGVPLHEAQPYMSLIRGLHLTLALMPPSRKFVRRLHDDLVGQPQPSGMFGRLRSLPARVQIAAVMAVLAGFLLFSSRRYWVDGRREVNILPESLQG